MLSYNLNESHIRSVYKLFTEAGGWRAGARKILQLDFPKWVWHKIKQLVLSRCWSLFPHTKVPLWVHLLRHSQLYLDMCVCAFVCLGCPCCGGKPKGIKLSVGRVHHFSAGTRICCLLTLKTGQDTFDKRHSHDTQNEAMIPL